MPSERRSRITLLLPAPATQAEFLLVDDVITELIRLAGGATVSSIAPSVFDGWWIDGGGATVRDANVLITADINVSPDDAALLVYLDSLKLRCQQNFQQDIVWLTVHPVDRIATGDFRR
jgi:hypothetical protein